MNLAGGKKSQTTAWIWRNAPGRARSVGLGFWGYYFFATPAGGD